MCATRRCAACCASPRRCSSAAATSRRSSTRFLDAHDGVEVELMLNDRNVDLIDEGIDVAVRIGPLADSGLSARPVGHVRRLWVASPAYLKRRGVPRAPADLAGHEAMLGTFRRRRRGSSPAPGAARAAAARDGCGSTTSRRGCARRARDAASRSSCPTRLPTSWRPAAGAPAAGLGAAAAAGASGHQGPGPPRAQDRRLPRLRGPAPHDLAGAVRRRPMRNAAIARA